MFIASATIILKLTGKSSKNKTGHNFDIVPTGLLAGEIENKANPVQISFDNWNWAWQKNSTSREHSGWHYTFILMDGANNLHIGE